MEEEIWKPIENYEELYEISNLGNVKSLNFKRTGKEQVLKPSKDKYGYLMVRLCKNGKLKTFKIHRLVASAFIPNVENKSFIDHINTNRTDNRVENLNWVTSKENMNNPLTKEKISVNNGNLGKFGKEHYSSKPILQFDLNGNFIRKWDCARDIERELGFKNSYISSCCNGKYKTAYGYIWGFETDYELVPFKVFDINIYRKMSA